MIVIGKSLDSHRIVFLIVFAVVFLIVFLIVFDSLEVVVVVVVIGSLPQSSVVISSHW